MAAGVSANAVAKILGVPRGTVQRWRHRDAPPASALRGEIVDSCALTDPRRYCYLLGAYLGDGHLTHRPPNGWTLRVFCDERYVGVIGEISAAMCACFPDTQIHEIHSASGGARVVSISHPALGTAFPQHGPGRKHTRLIELADWQRELTHAHPEALIRGLIHSDGCRCINHVKTTLPSGRVAEYEYVRYFFTNHSADIRGIFIEHCELLGVRVTQSNHRNLSISHRHSVAILESVVGPKS